MLLGETNHRIFAGAFKAMRKFLTFMLVALTLAAPLALGQDLQGQPLVHEGLVTAPADLVWSALTTRSGQESWMVAHSEIDLRVGGLMRTHYDPKGEIGDDQTIENRILSFDPGRMLSIQVSKAPVGFAFSDVIKAMWTVIYLTPEAGSQTRVRIVGLGFGDDPDSQKMRQYFDRGNAYTLRKLQERFAAPAPVR